MDKKWILIINPEFHREGQKRYILQEIAYDSPYMFLAYDREMATEYCVVILEIDQEEIG